MSQRHRSPTQTGAPACPRPRWWTGEIAGDLPPFDVSSPQGAPAEFGNAEQVAVATGLATPDFCLIQGGAAETRARIATEIAGRSPGRTLLIAPDPATLPMPCARRCAACADARPRRHSWLEWFAGWFGRRVPAPVSCEHAPVSARFDSIPDQTFDRVVVLEAQRLDEPMLESAVSRAARCVLLGWLEPLSPFDALWRRLTLEPWERENGRLVCRLRRVPAECRGQLEIETVADRPDIELRILPHPQPELAEIAFPASMRLEDAATYVVQQLGEAPAPHTSHGRAVTLPTHRRAEDTIVASQAVETLA